MVDAAARITPRTRAIAPVHLFGNPANVSGVQQLAKEHNLSIVWDAAQAHAARWKNRDIGSLPGISCYSFYPSKNMTTGEGGMICTDDEELTGLLKLLRSQGQTERYLHIMVGYNSRMTDIAAAIGRGQLRHLSEWTRIRRANAAYLRKVLSTTPYFTFQQEYDGAQNAYHQFSVLLDDRIDRNSYVLALQDAGIDCGVYYPIPQHRQPAFSGNPRHRLPVTDHISDHILSVPVHPFLSSIELICSRSDVSLGSCRRTPGHEQFVACFKSQIVHPPTSMCSALHAVTNRHILGIAYLYRPVESIGARRTERFVKHLPLNGYELSIVTTRAFGFCQDDPSSVLRTFDPAGLIKRRALRGASDVASVQPSLQTRRRWGAMIRFIRLFAVPDRR